MKASTLSRRFYWSIFFVLITRITIFSRRRPADAFTIIDTQALFEIILVGIIISFIFMSPRLKEILRTINSSSSKFFLMYYALCLVSAIWSLNAEYTLFRSLEMISLIILIFLIGSYYRDFFQAERGYIYISLISIILLIIMHARGAQISLSTLHTNQYSPIAAMAFVYCFAESLHSEGKRKRFLRIMTPFFGIITLIGTSATSNIAAFTGLMIVLTFQRKSKLLLWSILSFGLIILYISGSFESFWMDMLFPGKTEQDIMTLRGRKSLWDTYFNMIADQPILGYGFAVVSRMGSYFGTISATNTHNGLLEVLLGTGILGGIIFLFWIFRLVGEMIGLYKKKVLGIIGFFGAFTVAMINNLGRSLIGGAFDTPQMLFILLFSFFILHMKAQKDIETKNISDLQIKIS